jgi:hypothetical protein
MSSSNGSPLVSDTSRAIRDTAPHGFFPRGLWSDQLSAGQGNLIWRTILPHLFSYSLLSCIKGFERHQLLTTVATQWIYYAWRMVTYEFSLCREIVVFYYQLRATEQAGESTSLRLFLLFRVVFH